MELLIANRYSKAVACPIKGLLNLEWGEREAKVDILDGSLEKRNGEVALIQHADQRLTPVYPSQCALQRPHISQDGVWNFFDGALQT
jgi:hypothetical protein